MQHKVFTLVNGYCELRGSQFQVVHVLPLLHSEFRGEGILQIESE